MTQWRVTTDDGGGGYVNGNPPYDRFAGAAQAEEAELAAHFKGVELVEERGKDGKVKRDEFGRPKARPRMEWHGCQDCLLIVAPRN